MARTSSSSETELCPVSALATRDWLDRIFSASCACVMRFRPILMTTMAALLGGVPLMLGTGAGSELRQPLGYAIVGGLAVSQVLTLYTTPVVYIYLDKLQTWLFGKNTPAVASHANPAPAE